MGRRGIADWRLVRCTTLSPAILQPSRSAKVCVFGASLSPNPLIAYRLACGGMASASELFCDEKGHRPNSVAAFSQSINTVAERL